MPPKVDSGQALQKLERAKVAVLNSLFKMKEFILAYNKEIHAYQLKVRYIELDKLFNEYNKILHSISEISDEEDILNQRIAVEELFYETKAQFEERLAGIVEENLNISHSNSIQNNSQSCSSSHSLNLPKLAIPFFKGAYSEWQSFKDLFKSIIYENSQLSNVQKFYYLKSSLKGEPYLLIKNITVSDNNLQVAWQSLVDRYDNKLIIVNDHLRALYEMPHVSRQFSLREFALNLKQNLDSLKALEVPVESWDLIIIFISLQKIDFKLREAWELLRKKSELPTIAEFLEFLNHRSLALEVSATVSQSSQVHSGTSNYRPQKDVNNLRSAHVTFSKEKIHCQLCKSNEHKIFKCPKFLALSVKLRQSFVKDSKLCINCLSGRHFIKDCFAALRCKYCNRKHNTLLHFPENREGITEAVAENAFKVNDEEPYSSKVGKEYPQGIAMENRMNQYPIRFNQNYVKEVEQTSNKGSIEESARSKVSLYSNKESVQVLLSTALVRVLNADGKFIVARALLDSGSEEDFITSSLIRRLKIQVQPNNLQIQGISGNHNISINHSAKILISSCHNHGFQLWLNCSILDRITIPLPHMFINIEQWPFDSKIRLQLADPEFNIPNEIDMLIGAKTFFTLLKGKSIKLGKELPLLTDTVFGWVISGRVNNNFQTPAKVSISLCASETLELNETISKFWKVEEVHNSKKRVSEEDEFCEKLYESSHCRDESGRYIVELPLHNDAYKKLGSSFQQAHKRLLMLESRFKKNKELFLGYKQFIDEYLKLDHARYCSFNSEDKLYYFLPHFAIFRPSSSSTKLRVVFDASSKTSSGHSLNDVMYSGPVLYQELYQILLRFRTYKYVFTSDIAKMFRQIRIHEKHYSLQTILWRESPQEDIKLINLTTVTYGTAAAPYLAIRTLLQLAQDEAKDFPLASKCVINDFYMDDVLTGTDSLQEILDLQQQLSEMLLKGGFELHKWSSNVKVLIDRIPEDKREKTNALIADDTVIKTLGLIWNPRDDHFLVSIPEVINTDNSVTKRSVLSDISKFFDPLGFIAPVIIKAKILMQKIWLKGGNWDDKLDETISFEWQQFSSQIKN